MKQFARLLERSPGYAKLLDCVKSRLTPVLVTGLGAIHKAHYIYSLCRATGRTAHVLVPNEAMAAKLCEDLNTLFGEEAALVLPARELTFRHVEGVSHEYEHARLGVLGRLVQNNLPVVISSVEGAVQ